MYLPGEDLQGHGLSQPFRGQSRQVVSPTIGRSDLTLHQCISVISNPHAVKGLMGESRLFLETTAPFSFHAVGWRLLPGKHTDRTGQGADSLSLLLRRSWLD